jgi:hypothetical protein
MLELVVGAINTQKPEAFLLQPANDPTTISCHVKALSEYRDGQIAAWNQISAKITDQKKKAVEFANISRHLSRL